VPLTLEGPTRTMRGVPSRCLWPSHGDRRTRCERDGLVLLVWRGIRVHEADWPTQARTDRGASDGVATAS
jgi:hypothetical protein